MYAPPMCLYTKPVSTITNIRYGLHVPVIMQRFCLIIIFLGPSHLCAEENNREGLDFFEAKIRPLLVKHCYQCHSAGAAAKNNLKGDLFLDSRDASRRGGKRGPAIIPGQPGTSLLISALKQESLKMPPQGKLPDELIAHFEKWILLGAPDPRDGISVVKTSEIDVTRGKQHWAFQPLTAPTPTTVKDTQWINNPIDQFIRARQEAAGIIPNPTASAHQLIRRAYFDLIGLPPSTQEVDQFIARFETDAKTAYSQLIDGLLANQHYGERWGRHWMDIVRFAESNGYAFDGDRPAAWRYRDFVTRALNSDMPYDEFVRLQIAGDLLTNIHVKTKDEAKIAIDRIAATGFVVAGPYTTQQTQNERERSRYEQLDDMISTIGTSILGLTVGCARCHSHKYDPLSQFDYYRMAAAFADVGFSNTGINNQPQAFQAANKKHDASHQPLVAARTQHEQEQLPQRLANWLATRKPPPQAGLSLTLPPWHHIGPFAADNHDTAFSEVFAPEKQIDLAATYQDGKLKWTEQPEWKDNIAHNDKLTGNNVANYLYRTIEVDQSQVAALSLGSDDGIQLWVNGRLVVEKKTVRNEAVPDQEKVDIQLAAGRNQLLMKITNAGGKSGFYFAATTSQAADELAAITNLSAETRDHDQNKRLIEWYKGYDLDWLAFNQVVLRHDALRPKPQESQVFAARVRGNTYQFGDDTYKVYQLRRGNPDNKEEQANPGFFQVLMRTQQNEQHWLTNPENAEQPFAARIALSNWLSDIDHGAGHLMARVIVNRIWYHHFGHGIVATPSDFGTRGELPSHPQLLDWLAKQLIENGWQLKSLHKLIMNSAAYMQAGEINENNQKQDPENLLVWRRNPRRLEAEIIRDSLLAVSGTLDKKMFGKGTLDEKSLRRSVYFTIKRSQLIPLLQLFDAPDAMQGIASREQSTVAPQALAMMNSPIIRDLATRFAGRVRPDGHTPVPATIDHAYRVALSRPATDREKLTMHEFIKRQTTLRGEDENAESLAVQDFCHLMLCLNEFVFIE